MAGPVRQPIDVAALERYIEANVSEIQTPLKIKQFGDGQSNPTYLLTSPDGKRSVLRKKPPGTLVSRSAHRVDREFRIIRALDNTKVPVPKAFSLCEDESIIGTPFYLMEFIDGRIISDPWIPGVSEQERTEMWRDAVRTLANFHSVKPKSVCLESFGKPTGFYDRQLKTFGGISASQATVVDKDSNVSVGEVPHIGEMIKFFQDKKMQPQERASLVHGDFRIGNLIFHKTEPRVIGVLDWEMATIGHPLSDLASLAGPYNSGNWSIDAKPPAKLISGDSKLVKGLPSLQQVLAWYSEVAGWNPSLELRWGYAFIDFRDAVIMQGIAARYAARQASGVTAQLHASKMKPDAYRAWKTIQFLQGLSGLPLSKL